MDETCNAESRVVESDSVADTRSSSRCGKERGVAEDAERERSIGKSEPIAAENNAYALDLKKEAGRTEAANARSFISKYGDMLRWCEPVKKWFVWDGRRWAIDFRRTTDLLAKRHADQHWAHVGGLADSSDKVTATAMARYCKSTNQASGIRNVLSLARSEPGIPILPEDFDRDPWLLNVEYGTIDLRTGKLRPHSKEDLITKLAPVKFDPKAQCPQWERFLWRVIKSQCLYRYLRRLVGYSLTGDTSEQILILMYGAGANGKSTFINLILDLLGVDYAIKAPTDLVLAKGDAHPTGKSDLLGCRFVACVEADDGRRLNESLVKELTGGDRIRARRMRQDFCEFKPTHKLWLAANHKPVIQGTDHGIWRRIKLIPLETTIPDEEQDGQLLEKLRSELPGILNWALEGCRQWQKRGLGEPEEVRNATKEYRSEMDRLGEFLDERCEFGEGYEVGAKPLHEAYLAWCKSQGEEAKTMKAFGILLNKRDIVRDRTSKNSFCRRGIRLLESE